MQVKEELARLAISGQTWNFETNSLSNQPVGEVAVCPEEVVTINCTPPQPESAEVPQAQGPHLELEIRPNWVDQMEERSEMDVSEAASGQSKHSRKRTTSETSDAHYSSPSKLARTGEIIGLHD